MTLAIKLGYIFHGSGFTGKNNQIKTILQNDYSLYKKS